ncbi:MAG: type III pantothenate kinase [Planctomyces sp.]|nr:type III pantothenate kinase [Planctomyces sp.]
MSVEAPARSFAIDVGNTRIKFGVFEPLAGEALPVCRSAGFVPCGDPFPPRLAEEFRAAPGLRALLSGSNPPEMDRIVRDWPGDWPPLFVLRDRTRLPLTIDVDFPDRVGPDRLLNAVAAQRLRAAGQRAVIVDCGTATTVDYVDESGAFRGGAILPGIGMSARALHRYTAVLPLIPAPDVTASVPDVIGRNTEAAMRSGLFWGCLGGVRELVRQMLSRSPSPALVLITGGAGGALVPFLDQAQAYPHLPLQGLVLSSDRLAGAE